jgi:hypothetical protein
MVNRRQQDLVIGHQTRQLIAKLNSVNILPKSLAIDGLNFVPEGRMIRGTYAEVYRRQYNGQDIAIKEIRTAETATHRVKFQQVFVQMSTQLSVVTVLCRMYVN